MFGIYGIDWRIEEEFYETILLDPSDPHSGKMLYRAKFIFTFSGKKGWFLIASDIDLYNYSTKWKEWSTTSDVQKRVRTDALTKGLSDLGFNSDIFEGQFDDNKYVQEMKEKFKDDPAPKTPEAKKPQSPSNNNTTSNTGNNGTPAAQAKPAPAAATEDVPPSNKELFEEVPVATGGPSSGVVFPEYNPQDIASMFQAAVAVVNDKATYNINPSHIVGVMGLAGNIKRRDNIEDMVMLMGSLKQYLGQDEAGRADTMKVFAERVKK